MAANQRVTEQERSELLEALSTLTQDERRLFSTRCALRVFPLLAIYQENERPFNFWEKDQVSKNFLAVWHANVLVHCCVISCYEKNVSTLAVYNAAIVASDDATDAATHAAAAAANAIHAETYAANTTVATIYAAGAAYAAGLPFFPNVKEVMLSDLALLKESGVQALIDTPLWQQTNAEFIAWLQGDVKKAFEYQANEEKAKNGNGGDSGAERILENIWPIYWSIFNGQASEKDLKNTLEQLEQYFDEQNNEPVAAIDISETLANIGGSDQTENQTEETDAEIKKHHPGYNHNGHQAAKEDALNRQRLADSLGALLSDPANTQHQTIGLLGHWGIGKSTLIHLLKASLNKKENTANKGRHENGKKTEFLFAEFNAWEYEHTDNLQAGIAQEMIKTLSSPEPTLSFRQKFCWGLWRRPSLILRFAWSIHGYKLLQPVLWFLAGLLPFVFSYLFPDVTAKVFRTDESEFTTALPYVWFMGLLYPTWQSIKTVFAGPLAKELLTYLKLPNYGEHLGTIPIMREHIKKLTKVRLKPNQRVLYVVDDLDRCDPKSIVKIMEAVRMVLDIDNVVVVIAVDQRIALAALALHYKELAAEHYQKSPQIIARDYLSKIIHLPIVLTEPDESSVAGYLEYMWNHTGTEEASYPLSDANTEQAENEQERELNVPDESSDIKNFDQPENLEKLGSLGDIESPENLKNQASNQSLRQPENSENKASPKPEPTIKQVEGLSAEQKAAFFHWVKHFELSNPRQLKRLNNSYQFLRNYYGEDQFTELFDHHEFPMLVTLCALEYLNNLNDLELGSKLRAQLGNQTSNVGEDKITMQVRRLSKMKLANTTMAKAIEPFVLPGIEASSEPSES
ncbi:KAP family P-loop NTPase fold protein [Reinekea thalattae]|uniref:KAP NTPase domain-containing protein n=1 Tax=Reinekea thalattae TaxID=2593301 RepID=A0A5C8ZA60_9GAMM|nr:P-loop NTPase fold protein [Reinekea thalattae]TXR54294.1 hypothetical protein FME95_07095 [Reinekea thalattae]